MSNSIRSKTMLEGPERLLAIGKTMLVAEKLLTTSTVLEGSERLLTTGAIVLEVPGRRLFTTRESVLKGRGTLTTGTTVFQGPIKLLPI